MHSLKKTGVARLPLHYGKAPRWLFARMTRLAEAIVSIIVEEYGHDEFLQRVSDPFWFQALGCVLGYDWHSSGVTTVLTGVLKKALKPEKHRLAVCGGKGKTSLKTPAEIRALKGDFGFSSAQVETLVYSSMMSAKVDNTAIQAGYPLYHHAFFLSDEGKWAVVQQGMSTQDRTARRYHWTSTKLKDFVNEPHEAVVGDAKRDIVLDMTARESEQCRRTSVDVSKEGPKRVRRLLESIRPAYQKSLQEWISKSLDETYATSIIALPRRVNWKALRQVYEFCPQNYEELLGVGGVGPATVRGLALISELIYGTPPSWEDPVKFSFAYGGKDGVPRPVDKEAMDRSIQMLKDGIGRARIDSKMKLKSLRALRRFVPTTGLE